MNFIDYIIIATLGLAIFDGFRRGIVSVALDTLAITTALGLAYLLVDPIAVWLIDQFEISKGLAPFVSFLLIFWVADLIISNLLFLLHTVLDHKIPERYKKGWPVRSFGAAIALAKQIFLTILVVNLVLFLPVIPQIRTAISDSKTGPWFISHHPTLEGAFTKIIEPAVREAQRLLITPPKPTDKPIELDTPIMELAVDKEAEQELFRLVNQEREQRGLNKLEWREDLAEVGRKHSRDMWQRQYFSHVNPDGKTPFDRIDEAGIKYQVAGENLAMAPTTPIAHKGLMDSEGHRANILSPDYGQLGIGAVRNGLYGVMYTQLFKD